MRALTLTLLLVLFASPAYAQTSDAGFFTVSHEVSATTEALQDKAEELAKAKDYLDDATAPMPFPSALVGNLFLQIEGVSFTLYLRAMNGLTKVELESRERSVSDEAKEQAEAFLEELVEHAAVG